VTLFYGQNTPVVYSQMISQMISQKMMISEKNNVDDLFRQNMTEFLQTDIDGSFDFSFNAITIQSLENT
jgi:hypothetical protein